MTLHDLALIQEAWTRARDDSGYARASTWAISEGPKLMAEIKRLRMIVRVNALRAGATHAEVDEVLNADS